MNNEVIADNRPTNAAKLARMRFIDTVLEYYGTLNRGILMDYFGISTPQASIDVADYIKSAPHNMVYNQQERMYMRTEHFERAYP